jgi:hypothetical protein
MNQLLKKIEVIHNELSKKNFIWFPFLFLKFKDHEPLTLKRIILMIPCFTLYFSAAWIIKDWLLGRELSLESSGKIILNFIIFFTFWFNFVTAYFWNRQFKS